MFQVDRWENVASLMNTSKLDDVPFFDDVKYIYGLISYSIIFLCFLVSHCCYSKKKKEKTWWEVTAYAQLS